MPPFVPASEFVIHETAHWWVNHRVDTIYPEYLMVAAKAPTAEELPDVSSAGLAEFGPLLAEAVRSLRQCLNPLRVYCGRYGHTPGHTVHFHVIPVYHWTVRMFEQDKCCAKLRMFYPGAEGVAEFPPYTDFDGADMTLFIWHRFAEKRVEPPAIQGPTVQEVVVLLREEFKIRDCRTSSGTAMR